MPKSAAACALQGFGGPLEAPEVSAPEVVEEGSHRGSRSGPTRYSRRLASARTWTSPVWRNTLGCWLAADRERPAASATSDEVRSASHARRSRARTRSATANASAAARRYRSIGDGGAIANSFDQALAQFGSYAISGRPLGVFSVIRGSTSALRDPSGSLASRLGPGRGRRAWKSRPVRPGCTASCASNRRRLRSTCRWSP